MSSIVKTVEEGTGAQVDIVGEEFLTHSYRYVVGQCAGQPVICIGVDPEAAHHIYLEYDEVSLAAANELVREIEAGIKELNHA